MMNGFTFQGGNTNPLEKLEWDRTWMDHPEDAETKRIFYIGDSISWAVRVTGAELWGDTLRVDGLATSKALDNPYFQATIHLMRGQQGRVDHILFNNGLHGWHLADEGEYATLYRQMLEFLQREYPEAMLSLLLTTRVANPAIDERVGKRNQVARAIAGEMSLPVIDLEKISESCRDLFRDGVHFHTEANQKMAEYLYENLK